MKKYIRATVKDISEEDEQYKFYLAQSKETSPRVLEQLFELNEGSVNINLAWNPKLPSDLAVKLARWDGPGFLEVLSKLSRNPATSGEALAIIAEDPNITSTIRYHLAEHKNLPVSVQHALVESYDPDIRFGLAENPSLDVSVMYELADDGNEDVRNAIADRDDVPEDLLIKFADDDAEFVRVAVACNPKTPVELLRKLANSSEVLVGYYLTRNDNTPVDILQKLCNSEHRPTRTHAIAALEHRGIRVDTETDE